MYITVADGVLKHISGSKVSEKMLLCAEESSEVVLFTHSDPSARTQVAELNSDSNMILLSPSHYFNASGNLFQRNRYVPVTLSQLLKNHKLLFVRFVRSSNMVSTTHRQCEVT